MQNYETTILRFSDVSTALFFLIFEIYNYIAAISKRRTYGIRGPHIRAAPIIWGGD